MDSIHTSLEFLGYPRDSMGERGHVSPWKRAKQIQPSSHMALNSFVGNGSFPLFSPASQVPQSLLGPETTFQTPFFQCANRENFQRQVVHTNTSIFQRANKNIDTSEQVLLQSSQSPVGTSKVLNNYEDSQSIFFQEKQSENDTCNKNKASDIVAPTSRHSEAKRVPIFKTAHGKTSGMPWVPQNKGKKRVISPSGGDSKKKYARLPSFTHSRISAFKPVSKNATSESACGLPHLSSSTKEHCGNNTQGNKTQPLRPKFGKSHHCPNKKIKKERTPDVTDLGNEEGNREASDAALRNKTGKRSEVGHGPQTEPCSESSSISIKDELFIDEDNIDVTGISGIENESELENLFVLSPIQCTPAGKEKKNKIHIKNLPSTLSSKINQSHRTKTKKKIHSELNQDIKRSKSQGIKTNKKWQLQVIKGKKKNLSQACKDSKSNQCQTTQGCKKKRNSQVISNIEKKNPLSDCGSKHNSISDVQLKENKDFTKSSTSSTSKQQTTKHGLSLQKGKDACW